MRSMLVTLEVSKPSGWLKAYAFCRVERKGHAMRGEVRAGRREGVRRRRRKRHARGRPESRLLGARARAERTPNIWYMVVTSEVSRLSGWLKADACCRVEREGHGMRGVVRAGRREGVGRRRRKRRARGEGPTQGLLGARACAERT